MSHSDEETTMSHPVTDPKPDPAAPPVQQEPGPLPNSPNGSRPLLPKFDNRARNISLLVVAILASLPIAYAARSTTAAQQVPEKKEEKKDGQPAPDTARQPETDEQAVMAHGLWVYQEFCARCHGDNGEGRSGCCCKQGPPLVGSELTRWQVRAATRQGMPGMPAFRGRLSDAEITAVAAYVQRLGAGLPAE